MTGARIDDLIRQVAHLEARLEAVAPGAAAALVAQVEDRFGAAFVCVNGEEDGPDFVRADVVLQLLAEARRPEGA